MCNGIVTTGMSDRARERALDHTIERMLNQAGRDLGIIPLSAPVGDWRCKSCDWPNGVERNICGNCMVPNPMFGTSCLDAPCEACGMYNHPTRKSCRNTECVRHNPADYAGFTRTRGGLCIGDKPATDYTNHSHGCETERSEG